MPQTATATATATAQTTRHDGLDFQCSRPQARFVQSTAPNVVLQGGAGSGKTWAAVLRALLTALLQPGSRGMFVAPSHPQLQQAAMPHLLSIADDLGLLTTWDWHRANNHIKLPNGSEFWLRSADNPAALLGADLAWCVGDEVGLWKKQAYDYLMGRLRQPGFPHQAAFSFTPKGLNWCHAALGRPRDGLEIIQATTFDNPFLDEDFHDRLRREYGEGTQLWRQEVLGEYVAWEGLVYPQFGVDTHVNDPPPRNDIVKTAGGIDWGWTNPGVALVVALDAQDRMWIVHETYERERPIEWWAEVVKRVQEEWSCAAWYCDPSEPGNIDALRRIGNVHAVAANNAVLPGIAAVGARIADQKLQIAAYCTEVVRELQTYCWKQRPDGTVRADEPEKINDHAMDALRYAVMGLLTGRDVFAYIL